MNPKGTLEAYFAKFRDGVIGHRQTFRTPFGERELNYADWTATGRAYKPIEDLIQKEILPFVGNTHTESSITGTLMSKAYQQAKSIIKEHVNANEDDALIFCGSGMTSAVNKLQRILGLRIPGRSTEYIKGNTMQIDEELKPIVFVTHMEHHSNHISWLETIADVEIIKADEKGNVDLADLNNLLEHYKHRKNKIAAITACSNVTGIETPYYQIAKTMHRHGGLCFVDFACSAPYVDMNMHPDEDDTYLDAIYFSVHKFLGGPGTPGVLIFNKELYANSTPDQPGGGTVVYTNPWGGREYVADIEQREDGGTPPFLQGIKAAMCTRLKEEMGVENMLRREQQMLEIIFERFSKMKNVQVFESDNKNRLGVVSFTVNGAHYGLIARLLNDRFGIQVRGGCSCAGTYGHTLLQVGKAQSYKIRDAIRSGDMSHKPGWIRLSIHPVMTDTEIYFIMDAIEKTALHFEKWGENYIYDTASNEFCFRGMNDMETEIVDRWLNALATVENFV